MSQLEFNKGSWNGKVERANTVHLCSLPLAGRGRGGGLVVWERDLSCFD